MHKILIINHWGGIAGGNVSLMQIANAIKDMGDRYDLKVLCPDQPSDMIEWLSENGINTIPCKSSIATFNHYSGSQNFILSLRSIKNIISVLRQIGLAEVKKAISEYNPDLVVINSMTLLWLGPIIQDLGYKSVCFHRETYAKGLLGVRTKIMKYILTRYFHIVFISENDRYETGQTKLITHVITDKVDITKFDEIKRVSTRITKCRPFEILYLGGMSRLKGAKVIIKTLTLLKSYNIKLVFLKYNPCDNVNCKTSKQKGSIIRKLIKFFKIDYESSVLKIINKYDLWDRIEFHSTVKNPEYFVTNCDLVVFPSTEPHQSRPLYEAGIAQVPFILSDFKQTREFAINGYNCLTFDPNNYKDLARNIISIIENVSLRNEIVKNNYRDSIKYHNFDLLSEEIDSFFCEVLNEGGETENDDIKT